MENRLGFANYAGNLVTSRLGDLCERIMRKNSENQSDLPLTISSIDGLVDQRDYFNKVVAAKDMSGYYLLKRGEFAYNKSYSVGYDYGTIKRLNKYDEGCLSTLYICFAIKSNAIDSNYLECFFDSLVWYKDMANVCTEGARNHGLLNVDIEEFFNIKVVYPADIEEQKKTARILNNLDEKIKVEKTNVEKLKALKSSMLTKMFPKEGESVPEIRFKGFTEPWEQRKLNEICDYTSSSLTASSSIENGKYILYDANTEIGSVDSFSMAEDYITVIKDGAGVGRIRKLPKNTAFIGTMGALTSKNKKTDFLYYLLEKKNLSKQFTGSTIPHIYFRDYGKDAVCIPKDKEQQVIGVYFKQLDHLITLHQRKYEKLLDVKKAFLEKMIGGDN